MAYNVDIDIFRATDVVVPVTIAGSGSISGWTFALTVVDGLSGATLLSLTTSSGIAITDATARTISLTISAAASAIPARRHKYTLMRTNSGAQNVLDWGDFKVFPNYGT